MYIHTAGDEFMLFHWLILNQIIGPSRSVLAIQTGCWELSLELCISPADSIPLSHGSSPLRKLFTVLLHDHLYDSVETDWAVKSVVPRVSCFLS